MKPQSFTARKSATYLLPELGLLENRFGSIVRLKIFIREESIPTQDAKVVIFDENSLDALMVIGADENGECGFIAISGGRKLMLVCSHNNTDYKTLVYNGVRAI